MEAVPVGQASELFAMRMPLVIALTLLSGCSKHDTTEERDTAPILRAHDVSVLFPNPADASAEALLWRADAPGLGGPLLPEAEFLRNRRSLSKDVDDTLEYQSIRVVAVRFDPCFRQVLGGPCEPQIRLVFQPRDPAGGFFDGAVHALYALSESSWQEVHRGLLRLASLAPENATDAPLGVSPVLASRGLQSEYAGELKALVLRFAGPETLVRVTFMTRTDAASGQWEFSGFHSGKAREDGKLDRLEIPGLSGLTMQNITRERDPHAFDYVVHPKFIDEAGRKGVSQSALTGLDPASRAEVHAWALRQEDPAIHLPDTTDCASCHVANHIGRHLEGLDPTLVPVGRPLRALSLAETDIDNLRAFGYFGSLPQVSQRTANETAAVLVTLSR